MTAIVSSYHLGDILYYCLLNFQYPLTKCVSFTLTGYYHEFMLRGHFHLTPYMPRCRDARRLAADPNNEPDFYCINQIVGEPDKNLRLHRNPLKKVMAKSPLLTPPSSPPPVDFVEVCSSNTSQQLSTTRIQAFTEPSCNEGANENDQLVLNLALVALLLQSVQRV